MAINLGVRIESRAARRERQRKRPLPSTWTVRPRRNRKAEWEPCLVRENVLTTDD